MNSRVSSKHATAAKAAVDFAILTVRLEAAPFQNKDEIAFSPRPREAAPFQIRAVIVVLHQSANH
jgi:hypothetical protein